jgi:hypothetical protein
VHHGPLRVARQTLLGFQLLREPLDVRCLEATHALVVDRRVQSRALETTHCRDADTEALGDVIARERCHSQLVIALFLRRTKRHRWLRHTETVAQPSDIESAEKSPHEFMTMSETGPSRALGIR